MAEPVLGADRLVKRFGGVLALRGMTFGAYAGEIHALCGENGAGKSTLIKTLCGIHPFGSYEGRILLDGQPVQFSSIRDAEAAGIGVIVQELAVVPDLTVAENLSLGREPCGRYGLVDWYAVLAHARQLCDRFGVKLDPEARVGLLGIGLQQLVEILRALGREGRVLLLDEPTAALSAAETERLHDVLRDLKRRGLAIIYISHRLEEVFAIADRVTVLRDGESVYCARAAETDRDTVVRNMVGRRLSEQFPPRTPPAQSAAHAADDCLLVVSDLDVDPPGDRPGLSLRNLSFAVRAGEVLGIGGLLGAGRTELLMHLFGAWGVRRRGSVQLLGKAYEDASPAKSIARGLVLVTEDRKRSGLVLEQSVAFNLSLAALGRFTKHGLVDQHHEHTLATQLFARLRVRAPDLEAIVSGLSGGNQQKVVLGKALLTEPRVLLLDEPTRGIDVAAKRDVYDLIAELTASGHAVVLVSSELPELIGMSDRILMLGEGRTGGLFERHEFAPARLLDASLRASEQARKAALLELEAQAS